MHALVIHKEHDQIDCLTPDLQPKASTAQAVKGWSAPPVSGPTGHNSLSVLAAESKARFHQRGNYADTFSMRQYLLRNALIRSRSYLVQNRSRFIETILQLRPIAFILRIAEARKTEND
jgi:hypothetical protein